ncbi:BLUF domain-containing protein [Rubrivivax gelatinosus]|uniref:FAD-dependent sensor of blue light n=1 Tax=Rubrivivax gelatinosus TaxID=28068 RepID=A0A4R2M4L0_RUBGE|nr:BLUF domain-containing protein [Rubrivivax gelatinosus]MBK1690279.1 phosphonate transporter [Rubrivivax gelatinosus]TCO97185.1 FAD-dependent sensor of blue light [Rubrivivax gelatinosus]
MTHLTHCIYASAASEPFDAAALRELLDASRVLNERAGITGMLLYADGSFFQVIEGPAEAVSELFARIVADRRHDHVTRIIEEPIPRRSFGNWSMGFPSEGLELSQLAGFNDFFGSAACLTRLDAGRARKLLAAFGAGRWRHRLSDFAPLAA